MSTPYEMPRGGDFGPVPASEEHTQGLWSLVHSHFRLQQAGYVLWSLGQADLDKKKRCGRCTKGRSSLNAVHFSMSSNPELAHDF